MVKQTCPQSKKPQHLQLKNICSSLWKYEKYQCCSKLKIINRKFFLLRKICCMLLWRAENDFTNENVCFFLFQKMLEASELSKSIQWGPEGLQTLTRSRAESPTAIRLSNTKPPYFGTHVFLMPWYWSTVYCWRREELQKEWGATGGVRSRLYQVFNGVFHLLLVGFCVGVNGLGQLFSNVFCRAPL